MTNENDFLEKAERFVSAVERIAEKYTGVTAVHPPIDPIHPIDPIDPTDPVVPPIDPPVDPPIDPPVDPPIDPPVDPIDPVVPPIEVANYNLLDLSGVNQGFYITADGSVASVDNIDSYSVSDFIPVEAGASYTVSSTQPSGRDSFIYAAYYDENQVFIRRGSLQDRFRDSLTFKISPANTAYIRLIMNAGRADQNNRMITKGADLLPYREYRSGGTPPFMEVTPVDPINPPVDPVVPPTPAAVVVKVEDFDTPQAAVDHVAKLGGGRITVNTPAINGNIVISTDGIELFSDIRPFPILRCVAAPGNPGPLIIAKGGTNFILDGLELRGQKLSDDGKSNDIVVDGVAKKRVNATGFCSILVQETGAILRNFKAQYTGLDSLNVNYVGDVNLTVEDFYVGTCGRNPFSLIQGTNVTFTRGTFYIDNTITGARDGKPTSGLYLFDTEPNSEAQIWHGMWFKDVVFINNGTGYANNQVIFQDASATQLNDMDLHMEDCEFRGLNGKKSAITRIKLDNASKIASNIHFKRIKSEGGRALTKEGSDQYILLNSTFEDIQINGVSLTYAMRLSKGCVVDNFRNMSNSDSNMFVRHNVGEAIIKNTKLDPTTYK